MQFIKTSFLLLSTLLFISCGENTQVQITPDIVSIKINETNATIYSTDDIATLSATVTYEDQTNADATNSVNWISSDYDLISIVNGEYYATLNGGESNISINYEQYNDSLSMQVYGLKEGTLFISCADINTTGTHALEAKGEFINIDTNTTMDINRTIVKNIIWTADNDAILTIEDDIVTIDINAGDTNVTATVFDMNVTKTYTIN